MPLYDFRCASCGSINEEFRAYARRDEPAACQCGHAMDRTFIPPQVMRDLAGYQSPLDGSWVGSRSQHREHMRKHGVFELGNEKPSMKRQITIPTAGLRAELRNTVEKMKSEGTFRER